jgi:uncharacterized membrane-anchored protein YjiN (DUF445 family)
MGDPTPALDCGDQRLRGVATTPSGGGSPVTVRAVMSQTAVAAAPTLTDRAKRRDLRAMKARATGLLVLAAVVFVAARLLEDDHSWAGYVRATAEAAMVGGLADWFAVTALFRHPLGIPVPHTAIIPRRKDQLGASLGAFVEQNFLSDDVILEKLRASSIAQRAARWAREPDHAATVSRHIGATLHGSLDVLRDDDVQDVVERAVLERVRTLRLAPLAGRTLDIMTANGRHQELLDAAMRGLSRFLDENRQTFRDKFSHESPWWVPSPVDDRIFEKLYNGIHALLADVGADPEHDLRSYLDSRLVRLADELRHSPDLLARGEEIKEELLAHPAVRRWTGALWADLKKSLQAQSTDPDSELRQRLEVTVQAVANAILEDPALAAKVDRWIESAVRYVVDAYRHEIADIITTTVAKWDPDEAAERIELQVGRDLQFIRINGTLVGGLAGLAIHTVSTLVL